MEKRLFNKLIKKQMLLYGFEKNDRLNYSKLSSDGTAKLVVRILTEKWVSLLEHSFQISVNTLE